MKDIADVEMAMAALKGVEVMGRALRTDYAESKNRRGRGGSNQQHQAGSQRKESSWVDFLNNGQKEGAVGSNYISGDDAADAKMADIATADSYRVGDNNNNRNNNNRRGQRSSSNSSNNGDDTRRSVAASLYFGNLAYAATEGDLRLFLASCPDLDASAVGNVRMGKDTDGRSKGYAHVDFYEEGEAKKVYEKLHQQLLLDRKVHVDEASNNSNNSGNSKNSNRGY